MQLKWTRCLLTKRVISEKVVFFCSVPLFHFVLTSAKEWLYVLTVRLYVCRMTLKGYTKISKLIYLHFIIIGANAEVLNVC